MEPSHLSHIPTRSKWTKQTSGTHTTTNFDASTVTTATTAWQAPTFQTPGPTVPACSDTMCPDLDHKTCKDSMGTSYGVLCDTRFVGNIITTSGKHKRTDDEERDLEEAALAASSLGEREAEAEAEVSLEDREVTARTFTRTFDGCADACDMLDGCVGMGFNAGFAGNCQSMSVIEGSFPAVGEVAAIKQG
jgi:hypothetical protein